MLWMFDLQMVRYKLPFPRLLASRMATDLADLVLNLALRAIPDIQQRDVPTRNILLLVFCLLSLFDGLLLCSVVLLGNHFVCCSLAAAVAVFATSRLVVWLLLYVFFGLGQGLLVLLFALGRLEVRINLYRLLIQNLIQIVHALGRGKTALRCGHGFASFDNDCIQKLLVWLRMLFFRSRLFDIVHFALVFVEFDFNVTLVWIDDLHDRLLLLSIVVQSAFHHLMVHHLSFPAWITILRKLRVHFLGNVSLDECRPHLVRLLGIGPLWQLIKTLMLIDNIHAAHGLLNQAHLSLIIQIFLRRFLLLL